MPPVQDDNTFAHPLPEFPVRKPGRVLPTFQEKNEIPPPHIPAFLPAFPDKHTYVQTPQFEAHEENPNKQMEVGMHAWHHGHADCAWLHMLRVQPPTLHLLKAICRISAPVHT